jgi:hypothetical protein
MLFKDDSSSFQAPKRLNSFGYDWLLHGICELQVQGPKNEPGNRFCLLYRVVFRRNAKMAKCRKNSGLQRKKVDWELWKE